jgi:hypothetical protein
MVIFCQERTRSHVVHIATPQGLPTDLILFLARARDTAHRGFMMRRATVYYDKPPSRRQGFRPKGGFTLGTVGGIRPTDNGR